MLNCTSEGWKPRAASCSTAAFWKESRAACTYSSTHRHSRVRHHNFQIRMSCLIHHLVLRHNPAANICNICQLGSGITGATTDTMHVSQHAYWTVLPHSFMPDGVTELAIRGRVFVTSLWARRKPRVHLEPKVVENSECFHKIGTSLCTTQLMHMHHVTAAETVCWIIDAVFRLSAVLSMFERLTWGTCK